MANTNASTGEINFKNLLTHDLSKEKADRITTDFVFDSSSKLVLFNPLKQFRKMWDILLSFLLAFNLLVTPFTIGFSLVEGTSSVIFWLNRFVDLLFMADIGLNFETGIYAGEKIIMDKATVQRLYIRGWLSVDLISSIPLDLLVSLVVLNYSDSDALQSTDGPVLYGNLTVVQFMQVFRLLKLLKTVKIYENFEKALVFRYEDLGILRFLLFILFSLHWSACIFSWLDENICLQGDEYSSFVDSGLEDETRGTKYIAALYWALATMTTIGFGDISAKCSATRVFSLIVMLVSSVVYAYGLSYVMEVMRNKRKVQSEFRDLMDLVNKYMVFRKIPKDLREEIRKFFNYISESDAKKNDLLSERIILEELSPELRVAVLCHVNSGLLEKVPLFNQIQECIGQARSILQEMVLHMRSQVFRPLEAVLKEGSPGTEIFFVTSGTCVQIKWNSITVNVITEGEYYGETGFLHHSYQPNKSQMFGVSDVQNDGSATKHKSIVGTPGYGSQGNLKDLDEASKRSFGGIDLKDVTSDRPSLESAAASIFNTPPGAERQASQGKRHTYSAQSAPVELEHIRAQQRNSTTIGATSLLKDGTVMMTQSFVIPKPYAQRYSLVTQSYADLRYITRELYDEIVKSLPRNKLLKVNRLMNKRYQELVKEEEMRDLELERLYPEIKEAYLNLNTNEMDEEEEEADWRTQEVDFVEEEVIEQGAFDIIHQHSPSVTTRRRSVIQRRASTSASRRPSINMLMSPRKKANPYPSPRRQSSPGTMSHSHQPPPGMKNHPPSQFTFDAPLATDGLASSSTSSRPRATKQPIKKSSSLASPQGSGRKRPVLTRGSSGVLGSQNNSISNVIRKEHFVTTAPTIYQNAVPTMTVVKGDHNRFFERALSMAGPSQDNDLNGSDSDSDSTMGSVYSLKSFSDFDEWEQDVGLRDSTGNRASRYSRGSSDSRSPANSGPSVSQTLENIETIERGLNTLFGHVNQLKKEMSAKHGLVAVTEENESNSDSEDSLPGEGSCDASNRDLAGSEDQHDPPSHGKRNKPRK